MELFKYLIFCVIILVHCTNGNVRIIDLVPSLVSDDSNSVERGSSYSHDDESGESLTLNDIFRRSTLNYTNITSGLYCEPEVFHYDYIMERNRTQPATNSWKRAKAGERVGLQEICLKTNGLPLTRRCLFNKYTHAAEWESTANWTRVQCLRETRENIISVKLNTLHDDILLGKRLHKGVQGRREVTTLISGILDEPNYKILPADVHFTTQILKEVSSEAKDPELSQDVMGICSTLMEIDPNVLRMSADLNATNALLETFEIYMDALSASLVPNERCGLPLSSKLTTIPTAIANSSVSMRHQQMVETLDLSHKGVSVYSSSNISIFFVNPKCSNITGIAIYDSKIPTTAQHDQVRDSLGHLQYRFVYSNESVEALASETGLQVATFLPSSLWQYVLTNVAVLGKQPLIVLKVYSHDALFVDPSLVQTRKPYSKILSISIPGYDGQFPEILPFLLRNQHVSTTPSASFLGTGCGYWNYNTWVSGGIETRAHSVNSSVIVCGTNHLTQFSFLLGGSYKQNDLCGDILITPMHLQALDIISLVGCSLSLLGLVGIWVTAALFQKWRTLASTKVLLNMCVALTLQMILFVFVNTDDMSEHLVEDRIYIDCVALGAIMQYSILVLFTWMLIVALLQFQRYVTVIGIKRPSHYILKSAIAAWGFPLIPTLLVACIDPRSYIPTEYQLSTDSGICYPSGYGLTFGVVLPVTLIVIANFTIFIYVFYSISHSLNQTMQRQEKQMVVKQIRLSVLLFFLLGLSWVFGIFAFMKAGIVFSYLFCLTATMQGFVLFVYFVLLDDLTRTAWIHLLCPSRREKFEKKATEMQSMTTTSTGLESGERH